VLNFGWAFVVVFALSVLVYVLAYRFRLPAHAAARHINGTEQEAAVTEEQLAG
jgi:hypothetical protein